MRERRGRGNTHLDDAIIHARLLDQREEGHVLRELVDAAEAQIERLILGHLAEAARAQQIGHGSLLRVGEARAHEDGHGQLGKRVGRGLGRVAALVVVRGAHELDQAAERGEGRVVEGVALGEEDVLVREPRVLVQRADEVLVRADLVALDEGRLVDC